MQHMLVVVQLCFWVSISAVSCTGGALKMGLIGRLSQKIGKQLQMYFFASSEIKHNVVTLSILS